MAIFSIYFVLFLGWFLACESLFFQIWHQVSTLCCIATVICLSKPIRCYFLIFSHDGFELLLYVFRILCELFDNGIPGGENFWGNVIKTNNYWLRFAFLKTGTNRIPVLFWIQPWLLKNRPLKNKFFIKIIHILYDLRLFIV